MHASGEIGQFTPHKGHHVHCAIEGVAPEFGVCCGTAVGATDREGSTRQQNYQNFVRVAGKFLQSSGVLRAGSHCAR